MANVISRPVHGAITTPEHQAYQLLHVGFVAAPVLAGLDKFSGLLADWDAYLAPPIARVVSRWHPSLYTLFNTLPLLRTHVLAWLAKT